MDNYKPQLGGMSDEDRQTLYKAAQILGGGWGSPLPHIIAPLLVEVARHTVRSGMGSRKMWIASLRALYQTLKSVTDMEAAHTRDAVDIR